MSTGDPPLLTRGSTRIDLDPEGRLLIFRAVPSLKTASLGTSVNWDELFKAAGLDRSRFAEAEPGVLPRAYADEWKSWRGAFPETPDIKIRVEAAAYRGRPTMFEVLGSWVPVEGGVPPAQPAAGWRAIGVILVGIVPIAAALVARRNLRLGRGDRRGAFRTWAFAFGAGIVSYAIAPTHVPSLSEVDRMFATVGVVLFWSSVLFVVYLALEPYVRRAWPDVLITWSRLTTGRLRDPMVGRDLLVGTLAGLVLSLLEPLLTLLPPALGYPAPAPYQTSLSPLMGVRSVIASIASTLPNALLNGMIVMLMVSLIRQGIRGLANLTRGPVARVIGSNVTVAIVTLVLFVIIIKRNSLSPIYPVLDIASTVVLIGCMLLVALRFGLFALIVAFFVLFLASDAPLTLDSSRIYAGSGVFFMAVIASLGIAGIWMARAGQPLFGIKQ